MLWGLVLFSLLFQACVSVPSSPPEEETSINLLDQSKEEYQKCLADNPKDLSQCSVEKETYKTYLNDDQASLDSGKSEDNFSKNFNHILNWKTTWGNISTGFTGRTVFGLYPDYDGTLKGSIEDDGALVGYWFQKTSRRLCGYSLDNTYHWGTFRFNNFTRGEFYGNWAYCDSAPGSGGLWDGKRIIPNKR